MSCSEGLPGRARNGLLLTETCGSDAGLGLFELSDCGLPGREQL